MLITEIEGIRRRVDDIRHKTVCSRDRNGIGDFVCLIADHIDLTAARHVDEAGDEIHGDVCWCTRGDGGDLRLGAGRDVG
jgi:hypothetical protein